MGNVRSLVDRCSQEGRAVIYLIPSLFHIFNPNNNIYLYGVFTKRLNVLRRDNKMYSGYVTAAFYNFTMTYSTLNI